MRTKQLIYARLVKEFMRVESADVFGASGSGVLCARSRALRRCWDRVTAEAIQFV
jgi:hypothetical protein